jgi:hypothetical protein
MMDLEVIEKVALVALIVLSLFIYFVIPWLIIVH